MCPSTNSGGSPSGRLTFQPDTENVPSRVDIAIVQCTAVRAFPMPHSERAHTFRAARGDRPASRTRSGSPSFVGHHEHRPVPSGLVPEHVSECRPGCVEHGFCHPSSGKLSGLHIADDDVSIITREPRRLLVQVMLAGVGDLGVDRAYAGLVSGALGDRQRSLILPEMLQRRYRLAVAGRRQVLQPKVDADCGASARQVVGYLHLEADIPAASRVFDERARSELAGQLARLPECVGAPQHGDRIAPNLGAAGHERNPTQGPTSAETGPEPRAAAGPLASGNELPNDGIHSVGVQPQIGRNARCKSVQFRATRPLTRKPCAMPALGFALCRDAEIPDLIAGDRVAAEMPVPALDPVLEGQDRHGRIIAVRPMPRNFTLPTKAPSHD